ncbi:MAG: cobaltochelatase subunit CobT [Alphaproteobacteria bacterium]|nr:cobaltochelatase subunit CobT [Alphaproteobacteria bacterium]
MNNPAPDLIAEWERRLAAAMRAVGANKDLSLSIQGSTIRQDGAHLQLPPPNLPPSMSDYRQWRGACDAIAMWHRYHNARIHQQESPKPADAQEIFNCFEQARVESLGAATYAGAAENMRATLQQQINESNMTPTSAPDAKLLAMKALAVSALQQQELPDEWVPFIQQYLADQQPLLQYLLHQLQPLQQDQAAFARLCRQLLLHMQQGDPDPTSTTEEPGNNQNTTEDSQQPPAPPDETESLDSPPQQSSADEPDDSGEDTAEMPPGQSQDQEAQEGDNQGLVPPGIGHNQPEHLTYQVFCRDFDDIIDARRLASESELSQLRAQLDQHLQKFQPLVAKLANRLQRRLLARQARAWQFDVEEGLLDAARLSRVITNPLTPLSFKIEKDTDFRDTIVSLLLDNSGSMRGRPITVAAICAEILARTLERCGIKVEILGFTTRSWKGGLSRERWLEQGKQANPGRLNDLLHIIYKPADLPWRRVRKNLGLMLRDGLLKENIDGEALLWAAERLLLRPEDRRVLMVISDGAPVDDSTLSVNGSDYLEDHLHQAIAQIEQFYPIELLAIGIGHDVTRYYSRAVKISHAEELGGAMLDQLSALFVHAGVKRRRPN